MVSIDYYSLGSKIKATRKERRYTQEQLAELCEISTGFLCHIEAGTRVLSLDTLYRIALVLNTSIDFLLLDTAVDDDNFLQHITATIQSKPAERYRRFCNVVKVLAEHIDEI